MLTRHAPPWSLLPVRRYQRKRFPWWLTSGVGVGLVLLLGCSSDTTEPSVSGLSGSWEGGSASLSMTVNFPPPAEGQLVGTGSVTEPTGTSSLTVSGQYIHPLVQMNLFTGERLEILAAFIGERVRTDRIEGTLAGGDYDGETLTLTRR